jgi:DNA-binding response OmpR family regulator
MKNENKKILIVEDDSNFGNILREYLSLNEICQNGIL